MACEELRHRWGLEDVLTILYRNRLRWYGHVRKENSEWVKKLCEIDDRSLITIEHY